MTETQWIASTYTYQQLQQLGQDVSPRKLRLFVCACCRRKLRESNDVPSERAIRIAERFAEGIASPKNLRDANAKVRALLRQKWSSPLGLALRATNSNSWDSAFIVAGSWSNSIEDKSYLLLRDIFGNPFRPAKIDPAWLRWRDGTAVKLARNIYDNRQFDAMPILADALEEAGCTYGDILDHCREPGEHVRGCWVVDLVLGKK